MKCYCCGVNKPIHRWLFCADQDNKILYPHCEGCTYTVVQIEQEGKRKETTDGREEAEG